jgi:hypothetical protein
MKKMLASVLLLILFCTYVTAQLPKVNYNRLAFFYIQPQYEK